MNDTSRKGRPKVLHIITRLDRGGSATNTIACVDQLRNYGYDMALAYGATDDPGDKIRVELSDLAINVFHLPHLVRNISPWRDLAALGSVRRLISGRRFDLMHTHSSKAGVVGRIAARLTRLPVVHTPHGHVFYGYFGPVTTKAFVLTERMMAGWTNRIISLTDIETRESLERGIGRAEQFVTIHSGVPIARFRNIPPESGKEFRRKVSVPEDAVLFVSIGRLARVKGCDVLIEAFSRARFEHPRVFLAIVGDGEEETALKAQAQALGIAERVKFAGAVEDARPALGAADVFVLAGRNEGMGRAFIEAMACGRPVIGTAVGGVPSAVKDGETGMLVPSEDALSLARAMETLAGNAGLREQMGRRGAEFVYPEYDEDTMVKRLAELYRRVLFS